MNAFLVSTQQQSQHVTSSLLRRRVVVTLGAVGRSSKDGDDDHLGHGEDDDVLPLGKSSIMINAALVSLLVPRSTHQMTTSDWIGGFLGSEQTATKSRISCECSSISSILAAIDRNARRLRSVTGGNQRSICSLLCQAHTSTRLMMMIKEILQRYRH